MEQQRTLLINLKVLSKLRPHQRVNTTGSLFHIMSPAQTFWISISRWWSGARRTVDIARIQTLYETAISELESAEDPSILLHAMRESIVGLDHFKTTYDGDVTAIANIEYICDVVSATLRRYEATKRDDAARG